MPDDTYPRRVLLGTTHTPAIEIAPGWYLLQVKRSPLTGRIVHRG